MLDSAKRRPRPTVMRAPGCPRLLAVRRPTRRRGVQLERGVVTLDENKGSLVGRSRLRRSGCGMLGTSRARSRSAAAFSARRNKEACRLRVELAMASRRHPARPGETYTGWAVNFREATLPSLAEGRRSLYPRRRESRPLPRTDARGALASRAATVAHCGDRSAGGASRSRAILTPRHSVRERSARTDSRQP